MHLRKAVVRRNVREALKNCWFHVAFLFSLSVPVVVLMVLDYFNVESFYVFNQEFRFLATFKGRMFYLLFLWLLFLESVIDWSKIVKKKPRNYSRILPFFVCALVPLIYVLSVNFWGLDQVILRAGEYLGFTGYAKVFHWPLCVEYLVFALSFLIGILFAYGKQGLGCFSIALTLLVGMSIVYAIDTFYPQGVFKPFEMLALPVTACAAALLDILGYRFVMQFQPGPNAMPSISIWIPGVGWRGASIGWPCAGVHSLFLYVVIILLFFKRSSISTFRKFIYFVVGAFGTYFVNVLRIVTWFVILRNDGENAARFFHNSLGELFFIFWIFIYILIIISIEKFMLVEKASYGLQKLRNFRREDQKTDS